jgi:MSHA biogenesis protein MshI
MHIFSKKEKKTQGIVAIEIGPSKFSFAYTPNLNHQSIKNVVCGFKYYKNIKELPEHIANIVNKYNLKDFACNIVLHPDFYNLILIDKPLVPEHEYKLTVRWQIKEMVNIDVDDMAIETFNPSKSIQEHNKKLYVIAAKKSLLKNILTVVQASLLNPAIIDIHEFAIRNLLSFTLHNQNAISFLHILENKSIFFILKENEIHLARHLAYGLNKFTEEIPSDVVIEIKRSLDYYQYQLNQPQPTIIILPNMPDYGDVIAEKFNSALGIETECLNLNKLDIFQEQLSDKLQNNCYVAIGGLLRTEIAKRELN